MKVWTNSGWKEIKVKEVQPSEEEIKQQWEDIFAEIFDSLPDLPHPDLRGKYHERKELLERKEISESFHGKRKL